LSYFMAAVTAESKYFFGMLKRSMFWKIFCDKHWIGDEPRTEMRTRVVTVFSEITFFSRLHEFLLLSEKLNSRTRILTKPKIDVGLKNFALLRRFSLHSNSLS
jgi:hypothetical protein